MNKAFIPHFRFAFVSLLIGFAFCVLAARLVYLHLWVSQDLETEAQNSRERWDMMAAQRGNILDAKGNVLAFTEANRTVGVDPSVFEAPASQAMNQLAELLGLPVGELEKKCQPSQYPVTVEGREVWREVRWRKLASEVDEDTYDAVMALQVKGVRGDKTYTRQYPANALASHLVGFVNKEGTAVMGVEQAMDFYLSGQAGWRESERDGRRRELTHLRSREIEPVKGLNVELSLDFFIQHVVEKEIEQVVKAYDPMGVTVIVSEPATGDLLALANYPTFDLNRFNKAPQDHLRNRAIADQYEPGSVFKIVPAGAALEEAVVEPWDVFNCASPTVQYNGRTLRLPKDHHTYQQLNVGEIVVKSSNRGAAHLGVLLGEERLHNYANRFGFGERSGFLLKGEVPGTLHPVKRWDGLTITRMPMGHAVGATPLQTHYAMSVMANQGVLMEPRLVRRVVDDEGNTVIDFPDRAKRRVLSSRTTTLINQYLQGVVSPEGTAAVAQIPGYQVAGKTGTTQKIVNGRYSRDHHVASFSGFFPASNPQLVITVVVDDAQVEGYAYGGRIAGPVFKNIASSLIQYRGINRPQEESDLLALHSN